MNDSDAIEQILELGFLGAIAKEDLLSLRPTPQLLLVKAGDTLTWQGEAGDAYYLLLRGRLRRFVNDERGARRFIGDIFPGQGVGASGLLTQEGNAATTRVTHDSEVVRFSRATFLQMMVLSWEFAISVSREQIERVRAAAAPSGRHPTIKNVAIVPLEPTLDLQSFVGNLSEALGRLVSVVAVDEASIDLEAEGSPSSTGQRTLAGVADMDTVTSRLDAFEQQHDMVLYPLSSAADAWARLIAARADLVLLVSSVGGASDLCEIESVLIGPTEEELLPRIDLVIMHGGDWSPTPQTGRWLDVRDVNEWHHIRSARREDFHRLARLMTGHAITLVLSGGGARGFAEIGVFKALLEAGITIDRFAGTSMGAMIGSVFASGMPPDEVVDKMQTWARKGRIKRDYTFPAMSLLHARRLHLATHELFGDVHIEDLPRSFLCLSADLSEMKPVVHDRGPLWRAIRASMSVPGIGPPLFDRGRILSDGAIVSNVPADVVAQRYAGRIIIVAVMLTKKFLVPDSYDDFVPSGWQILWQRINPFAEPLQVPSIFEILQRSALVASSEDYRKARELADLSIIPPISGIGLLDFEAINELVEVGYQHATQQLKSIGAAALQEMFPGLDILPSDAPLAAETLPPINRGRFVEILGVDDDETFREMLGFFIEMFPAEIGELATAIANGTANEISELARRARSAAANVAAPALTALLQNIESRAANDERDGLTDLLDRVRSEFRRIELYSRRI